MECSPQKRNPSAHFISASSAPMLTMASATLAMLLFAAATQGYFLVRSRFYESLLLLLITRTWHGTLLPLTTGAVSAIWALGAAKLMGFHLDPLVIVVAFLITAHSV